MKAINVEREREAGGGCCEGRITSGGGLGSGIGDGEGGDGR